MLETHLRTVIESDVTTPTIAFAYMLVGGFTLVAIEVSFIALLDVNYASYPSWPHSYFARGTLTFLIIRYLLGILFSSSVRKPVYLFVRKIVKFERVAFRSTEAFV